MNCNSAIDVSLGYKTYSVRFLDSCQELDDLFNCCLKNFKKDLKPLNGVSKSQIGELEVAVDQRKK